MRDNLIDIYKVLTTDETLLRLLFYKPSDASDNPLDIAKQNILDKSIEEKWDIIMDCIKTTPSVKKLDTHAKCRICFYPGVRRGTNNYLLADQQITFDIFVAHEFDEVDFRLSWILDRLNELINRKRITGIGKINFDGGRIINSPVDGYIAYRISYDFGSGS